MQIIVDSVSHSYSAVRALDDVDFKLNPGFNVLLGPNGAGKSTLFSLLTGLDRVSQGSILFDTYSLKNARQTIMSKMGVVFQQSTLDLDLTVKQNLTYFAALHGLPAKQSLATLSPILEQLDLIEKMDWKVRKLNGGHRRRVEIARCLIHSPTVLLLDEPTVGLDIASRRLIVEVVHKLADTQAVTVLWATHLLEEVSKEDHLLLLAKGKLQGNDRCEDLLKQSECESVSELFNQLLEVG
jgi:ABC-2 type transport system ATP-binding protein